MSELVNPSEYRNGDIVLNNFTHQVWIKGKEVRVPRTQYRLLHYLLQHKGRCIPYREILTAVWGGAACEELQYVRVFTSNLRKVLGDTAEKSTYITVITGIGLRMNVIETNGE